MSNLSPQYWNPMVTRVADRVVDMVFDLVDKVMAAGYPPFTEPPPPEMRYLLYQLRPIEEWRTIARTDPERALDDLRDFANMGRRRGEPEVALPASRTVLAELAVQGVYGEKASPGGNGSGLAGVVGGFGGSMGGAGVA